MTDRAASEDWFRRYREAWESNDEHDIRGLFTEDAVYNYHPHEPDPVVGVEAIVESWLENRDEPGDTEFEWELLAVDGEVAIARCVTAYVRAEPPKTYDNLFVIRLRPDGRATEFTEWYIERKDQGSE